MNPTLTLAYLAALGLADGPYAGDVTVEASDGTNVVAAQTTLIIHNVAPNITSLHSSNETPCDSSADGLVTVHGSFSDPAGDEDVHTVTVDWGDGAAPETLGSVDQTSDQFDGTHAYATGGIYTVTVTVEDEDGGVSEARITTAVVTGVGQVDGTLYVIGTPGKDHVDIKLIEPDEPDESDEESDDDADPPLIRVKAKLNIGGSDGDSDEDVDEDVHGDADENADVSYFDPATVDRIEIYLCDGDDHAHVDNKITKDATIEGNGGNDDLDGGGGNDTIDGGAGDDKIKGRDGDDILLGGDGKDDLKGENGNDVLSGGDGDDKLDGGKGKDVLIGGRGADRLKGGSDGGSDGGKDHGKDRGKDQGEDGGAYRIGDILIGGWTRHDSDVGALKAIRDVWTSDDTYEMIINTLTRDGGLLDAAGANRTVFGDGEKDKLDGSEKAHDLFFAELDDLDRLKGDKDDEVIRLS